MVTRRNFVKTISFLSGAFVLNSLSDRASGTPTVLSLEMTEESQSHQRTWMSFVANDYVWPAQQIPEVKRNLALIAKTIAKYEPVSMLVDPDDYDEAITLLGGRETDLYPIELVESAT